MTDHMDDASFTQTIQEYLSDFKDGHLSFRNKNSKTPFRGFRVRRYEDALYVTEVLGEQHLQVGNKITAINGDSIKFASYRYYKLLQDDVHERQMWNKMLQFVDHMEFERDGEAHELDLSQYAGPAYTPEYDLKQPDGNENI